METHEVSFLKRPFFRKKGLILTGVIILVILAALAFYFLKLRPAASNSAEEQRTARVTRGDISLSVTGSGPITSSNRVDLSPVVSGKITKVNFKEGDQVKAGDVLYEIDDSDAKLNVEKLNNSIAQTQLSADSNSKSLSGLNVTAPFSGRVTDIIPKAGDDIGKNSGIMTITDTSTLKVVLQFSGAVIKQISKGMSATVNIQDYMQSLEGRITYVSRYPYATGQGGQVYDVEITVDNPGSLTDGMTVNAEIGTASGSVSSINSGKLEYVNTQVLKSLSGGTVKSISVMENEYVQAGQSLMTLENEELAVSSQTTDLKIQDLYTQLDSAEKQLEYYKITAPFDGTIIAQDVNAGDNAKAGTALGTISDMGHMEFSVDIDELDIAKVQIGQKANITLDALPETTDKPLSGKVSKIAMEGNTQNGVTTYPVTIQLDDSTNIRTGMNANAEIMVSEKTNVLIIPLEAVQKIGNRNIVMVRGNGTGNGIQQGNAWSQNGGQRRANRNNGSNSGNANPGNKGNGYNGNAANPNSGDNSNNPSNGGTGSVSANGRQSGNTQRNGQTALGRNSAAAKYYANAVPVQVELGTNNDTYVEVVSGLKEGDTVILPPLSTGSSNQNNTQQRGFGGGMGGFGGVMGGQQQIRVPANQNQNRRNN